LIVPNKVVQQLAAGGYTRKNEVSNIISGALMEHDILTNGSGEPVRIFYDHAFNEGKETALGVFTNEDSKEIDTCFKQADKSKTSRVDAIQHLFKKIKTSDTFKIDDDLDVGEFVLTKLFKDLGILSKKVLLKDQGAVKQYYGGD